MRASPKLAAGGLCSVFLHGILWGPSAPFPAHLSSVFHQALPFPWVPPRCIAEAATFSSGNPTPFFLVPACINTCVLGINPLSSPFLCLLQPPFLSLLFVLHLLLPPSRALHGHQHEVKVPGCNSCIPSVLSPSPCGVEAAEKTSLMWPLPRASWCRGSWCERCSLHSLEPLTWNICSCKATRGQVCLDPDISAGA